MFLYGTDQYNSMKEPKVQPHNSHLYSMSKVLALKITTTKKKKKNATGFELASYQPQSTSIILIYSSSFMHFFWLHSTRSVVLIVRFQHVFLSLRSKTKKSECLYKQKGLYLSMGLKRYINCV